MIRYFDRDLEEQNEEWATIYFGPQNVYTPTTPDKWTLAELHEYRTDPALMIVTTQTAAGEPVPGVMVALGTLDGKLRRDAETNEHGHATFPMDKSFRYGPPGESPHYGLAIVGPGQNSDVYNSVGIVRGQRRTLHPVFVQPEPEPDPILDGDYRITLHLNITDATVTVTRPNIESVLSTED